MTIEQSADDPAVQHARKRLVMRLRMKLGDQFIALDKTANAKTLFIYRSY